MEFTKRYKQLNPAQKQAVDHIEGPVMVIAGPGTGKTELLSMRAANILRQTDATAQNILCLTFTESGAEAMRRRLAAIIGPDAYKIAVHTFHSFGSDIIGRYSDYFYQGAHFRPADEVSTYEILRDIFDELEHSNPLASKLGGEYTHLADVATTISELKKSGLTSDELLHVLDDNDRILDACEADLQQVFAQKISKTTKDLLAPIAIAVAKLPVAALPPGIAPLGNTLALGLSHAIDNAEELDSTKPVTAWRNQWLEKDEDGQFIFKDRRRQSKLRAASYIYYRYLTKMQDEQLYDFDDMVLRTVHALEVFKDLRYNLQEQYQYIMVDEFQDTNLAQARLLHSLTHSDLVETEPNIMVVGDDDQAIYSFQGAEVSNILQFRDQYESVAIIPLTDNYRSSATVLEKARTVITQGQERLENYLSSLDKTLTARGKHPTTSVALVEHGDITAERAWLARAVKKAITSGTVPDTIAVIARRHRELIELLPFFALEGIEVSYERRENVLEHPLVQQLTLLGSIVDHLAHQEFHEADSLLPQLLAHPAWEVPAATIWQLGLQAKEQRKSWLETMAAMPDLMTLHTWLLEQAKISHDTPLEPMLDTLIGRTTEDADGYVSPLFGHFFSADVLAKRPADYLAFLTILRTLRKKLREYRPGQSLTLADFLTFIDLHARVGTVITATQPEIATGGRVHLMTAHKSKGLEFDTVFIHGAIDSAWGTRVRSRSRLIGYPENLPLAPAGDSIDERLRLFFVAMTRAKSHLTISYGLAGDTGSAADRASFLVGDAWQATTAQPPSLQQEITIAETAWHTRLVTEVQPDALQQLLAPSLARYKLSATHLAAFLDVTRGGPQQFLLGNLLRFPRSMSPDAVYGSAVHQTLQQTHAHFKATGKRRPLEDILSSFETNLLGAHLSQRDYEHYLRRGIDSLQAFFDQRYDQFITYTTAELNFAHQNSRLGEARLTGSLDAVAIDTTAKTLAVTDFKTGKAATSWKGKTTYDKIKLHHYRQQLLFYKLLVEHSRDYGRYTVTRGYIDFVEPTAKGNLLSLETDFAPEELQRLEQLIHVVWDHIQRLDLPDTSHYSADYKGIVAFENDLLDVSS